MNYINYTIKNDKKIMCNILFKLNYLIIIKIKNENLRNIEPLSF